MTTPMRTKIKRARTALGRAEEREHARTAALHALVADTCPDDDEPQPRGGTPRGWKRHAEQSSGYTGQGITNIRSAVRAARSEAGEPVRAQPRETAADGLAGARAELDRATAARERARTAYYAAIVEAMPPSREGEGRVSGEERELLRELRELTGYPSNFLRRIQRQHTTDA